MAIEGTFDPKQNYVMAWPDGYIIKIGGQMVHVRAPNDMPAGTLATALSWVVDMIEADPNEVESIRAESARQWGARLGEEDTQ